MDKQIRLSKGYFFNFEIGRGGEIEGYISESEYGFALVKGTSGWYRTDKPMVAASLAAHTMQQLGHFDLDDYEKSCFLIGEWAKDNGLI